MITVPETTRNNVAAESLAIIRNQLLGWPESSSAPEFSKNNCTVLNIGIDQSRFGVGSAPSSVVGFDLSSNFGFVLSSDVGFV